jgi:hypothetical protein
MTCSPTTLCTLDDMVTPIFTSPQSPIYGHQIVWYGTNLCGGIQGPVWWGGNSGTVSNYDGNCTPAQNFWAGGALDLFGVVTPYGYGGGRNPHCVSRGRLLDE